MLKQSQEELGNDKTWTTEASYGDIKANTPFMDANAKHIDAGQEADIKIDQHEKAEPEYFDIWTEIDPDGSQRPEFTDVSDSSSCASDENNTTTRSCASEYSYAESCGDIPVCLACAALEPQMCRTCADSFEECEEFQAEATPPLVTSEHVASPLPLTAWLALPTIEEETVMTTEGQVKDPTPSSTAKIDEHDVTRLPDSLVNDESTGNQTEAQYGPRRQARKFRPAPPPVLAAAIGDT